MRIQIPSKIYQEIMYIVQQVDTEVSGMGRVTFDKDTKTFVVQSHHLLDQEVGPAHTDLDSTAIAKAMSASRTIPGEFSFWYHSHVNMNAFMSGQDQATAKEQARHGYCVAVVFNKRGEYKTAVAWNQTEQVQSTSLLFGDESKNESRINYQEDIPLEILHAPMDAEVKAKIDEDIKTKVRARTYQSNLYGGWRDNVWDKWRKEYDAGTTTLMYSEWLDVKYNDTALPRNERKQIKKERKQMSLLSTMYKEPDSSPAYADITLVEEARALGVTKEKYIEMLDKANSEQLAEIDERINAYYGDKYGYYRGSV